MTICLTLDIPTASHENTLLRRWSPENWMWHFSPPKCGNFPGDGATQMQSHTKLFIKESKWEVKCSWKDWHLCTGFYLLNLKWMTASSEMVILRWKQKVCWDNQSRSFPHKLTYNLSSLCNQWGHHLLDISNCGHWHYFRDLETL